MSIFTPATTPCPVCDTPKNFAFATSVNGGRRDDLRTAILDDRFQVERCEHCGHDFRPPPLFSYIDDGRGDWILIRPSLAEAEWEEFEAQARATFNKAYGPATPLAAREIGRTLKPRVAFGWPALREKLLCSANGLDDVELELTKLAVIRKTPGSEVAEEKSLRLVEVEPQRLTFAWFSRDSEVPETAIGVPRKTYDIVASEFEAWAKLRQELEASYYVDLNRFFIGAQADENA
jgi:hypothetical protein